MAGTQHVECVVALFGELAPLCDGKGGGESSHAGREDIFPHPFFVFGQICMVYVRQCVLETGVLACNELLNIIGCFVDHFVQ